MPTLRVGLLCVAFVFAATACESDRRTAVSARSASAVRSFVSASPVSAGGFEDTGHTCLLVAGGGVRCWGDNDYGELGNGTMTGSRTPVAVERVTGATAVSAGGNATCAVVARGRVKCWGFYTLGSFGGPASTSSPVPLRIKGITNAVAVSTSGGYACAVLSGGAVTCWGAENLLGTLGSGTAGTLPRAGGLIPPARVRAVKSAVSVSAGYSHACALLSSGAIECWGENPYGELGRGPTGNEVNPSPSVVVEGISTARAVAAGDSDTCALLAKGTVECWGWNDIGQLGDGGTGTVNETPVAVKGITGATAISLGGDHACAVLAGGHVECWGENLHGQLGDGRRSHGHSISWGNSPRYDFSPVPVKVIGISDAVAISAGSSHTCATLVRGAVKCWGDNLYGQLGDGRLGDSASPAAVVGARR